MHPAIERVYREGGNIEKAMIEASEGMRLGIQQLLEQKPFEPFRIHMTGKHVHEVRNPEWAVLRSSVLAIKGPDPDAPGQLRERVILSLIHVVSLEPLSPDEPTAVRAASPYTA